MLISFFWVGKKCQVRCKSCLALQGFKKYYFTHFYVFNSKTKSEFGFGKFPVCHAISSEKKNFENVF